MFNQKIKSNLNNPRALVIYGPLAVIIKIFKNELENYLTVRMLFLASRLIYLN